MLYNNIEYDNSYWPVRDHLILRGDENPGLEFVYALNQQLSTIGFSSPGSVTIVFKKEVASSKYFFELLKSFVVATESNVESFFWGDFYSLNDFLKFKTDYDLNIYLDLKNFYFLSFYKQEIFYKFINFYFFLSSVNQSFFSFIYILLPGIHAREGSIQFPVFDFMPVICRGHSGGSMDSFIDGGFKGSRFLKPFRRSESIGSISIIYDLFILPLQQLILVLVLYSKWGNFLSQENKKI